MVGRSVVRNRFRGRSWRRLLLSVAAAAALTAVFSGALRGASLDANALRIIQRTLQFIESQLQAHWMHPRLAQLVCVLLTACLVSLLLLLAASGLRRIPFFIGFLVMSEVTRRHGRTSSYLDLAIGLSAPLAAGVTFAAHGVVSLLAGIHLIAAFAYIQLTYDPNCAERYLGHYAFRSSQSWDAVPEEATGDLDEDSQAA